MTQLDDEIDGPSEEERAIQNRRRFMYSDTALKAAQVAERIFIRYPAFGEAMQSLDRCFQLARDLRIPNGVLLTGPSGSGKTSLATYFRDSIPPSSLFEPGTGAIALRLPHRPSPGQAISALLRKMQYPFAEVTNRTVYIKRDIAFEALRQKGCRVIFVDEAHYLGQQQPARGHGGRDTAVSELLREIIDELNINLVLLADTSADFLQGVDPALANRITVRHVLSNFQPDALWQSFVTAFCKLLSEFDSSYITAPGTMKALHAATRGNMREHKRLITEAVLIAADDGSQRIHRDTMNIAFARVYGKDVGRHSPFIDAQ